MKVAYKKEEACGLAHKQNKYICNLYKWW